MAFLTFQKQGGGRYTTVYATVARYGRLKGGGRGAVQERLYIGRLDEEHRRVRVSKGIVGTAEVRLGLDELREQVSRSTGIDAVRAWLAAQAAGPGAESETTPPVCAVAGMDTVQVGQTHVLLALARALDLDSCLTDAFGEKDGAALLYLAMHQAARREPLSRAWAWLDDQWLPPPLASIHSLPTELADLVRRTAGCETVRKAFFAAWIGVRRHPPARVYETTSAPTSPIDADAADDERDPKRPGLILVCDRRDDMPLFCGPLRASSMPDPAMLEATTQPLRAMGLTEAEFVLGPGFCTTANLRDLLCGRYGFTVPAPPSMPQARNLIRRHRRALNSPGASVLHEGRTMRHVRDDWTVDMGRDVRGRKRQEQVLQAHVFLDPRTRAECVAAFDELVLELERRAAAEAFADRADAERWLDETARGLRACLAVTEGTNGEPALRRRLRTIAARTAQAGFQILLTSTPGRDPIGVLTDCRSRGRAVRLFERLRGEERRLEEGATEQRLDDGRVFVAFLALALRTELENRMRAAGLLEAVSPAELLAQMGCVRAVRLPDGTRALCEPTGPQREWLAELGLEPVQVQDR